MWYRQNVIYILGRDKIIFAYIAYGLFVYISYRKFVYTSYGNNIFVHMTYIPLLPSINDDHRVELTVQW